MITQPSFEEYRQEWLQDILEGSPSTSELGNRFSRKLITQWLDINDSDDDIIYCDGKGDGGIDIAYLRRSEPEEIENDKISNYGDTWYLIQSKYGSAFRGTKTILDESIKVIDTLKGDRSDLSSIADSLLKMLQNFLLNRSPSDRLILVFATEEALNSSQKKYLTKVQEIGRMHLGNIFDVETVSIDTIYKRILEEPISGESKVRITINADLAFSGKDLLVGAIPLRNLYGFLKSYRKITGDLDRLYERNVRKFLGAKGKVNRSMYETLQKTPEQFGLYNNGITIVVENFSGSNGNFSLIEPYIVNGCQTSRTIWDVFHQKFNSGGTGKNAELLSWKAQAEQGIVIAKIVRVGNSGDELLEKITRYTNNQNAVREKDFLALTSDFRKLSQMMGDLYNIYLETQRGGWESQRAYQKQHPNQKQYHEHTNVFDLIKVYGSGWLGEAGVAMSRNSAFLPNGTIFRRIFNPQDSDDLLTVEDFYAAYLIQKCADLYKFGRTAEISSRRQTRFLFYMVVLEIIRGILKLNGSNIHPKNMTQAVINIFNPKNEIASNELLQVCGDIIGEYMQSSNDDSIFKEPAYQQNFNNNLVSYLSWEQLGKSKDTSPNLHRLIALYIRTMSRGNPSPKDIILKAINE
ncbi:AIPR family protein [Chloroflexia bacterium SDU3-3]|nr:AIPR family protein [Chloroflexia bacterium SDU3-3]